MEVSHNSNEDLKVSAKRVKLMKSTYFDSLSNDVHLKILLMLENLLYKQQEQRIFMLLLFSEFCPFRAVVPSCFSSATFDYVKETSIMSIKNSSVMIASCELVGEQEQSLVRKIFSTCGASFRSINCHDIVAAKFKNKYQQEEIASLVLHHCPNIEQLYNTANPLMVQKYASQLRSFEWIHGGFKSNVAMPELRECSNLKCFVACFESIPVLITQLQAIGSTLEELVIHETRRGGSVGDLLDTIQEICRKLSIISLSRYIIVSNGDKYTSLLCSYGEQIVQADVQKLGYDNLRKVTSACTNLQVKYHLFYPPRTRTNKWKYIGNIGSLLLKLRISSHPCDGEECLNAMKQCTNLRELHVARKTKGNDIQMLFSKSLRALESLTIEGYKPSKRNDALIASRTGALKYVSLWINVNLEKKNSFKGIAESNPNLRSISIHDKGAIRDERTGVCALEITRKMMATFSKCCSLTLDVQHTGNKNVKKGDIIDICKIMPCRGVSLDIRIGYSRYSQYE